MNDELLFERLASHDGPAALDSAFDDRLFSILQQEMRRRRSLRPALLLVATLVLVLTITAAIAVGSGVIEPPWVNPSLVPTPTPFTGPLPCEEASVTPAASISPEDLTWNHERAAEDWPGALRGEPSGCAPVVVEAGMGDMIFGQATRLYSDPQGDLSPLAPAWIDIVGGDFKGSGCFGGVPCVSFDLAGTLQQPIADPREEWIAYGIVVDTTGDGLPDARYGVDNAPGDDAPLPDPLLGALLRMWEADLNTGRTFVMRCCGGSKLEAFLPGDFNPMDRGSIGLHGWSGEVFRFYVWASVIRPGAAIWTDYAPDFGWLAWPGNVATASPALPEGSP